MWKVALLLVCSSCLVACGGRESDETAELEPRIFSDNQRAGFDIDGAQIGMTPQQVLSIWQQRHPGAEIEKHQFGNQGTVSDRVALIAEGDRLEAYFSAAPSGNRAYLIERRREFRPPVVRTSVESTFQRKLGVLAQPEPWEINLTSGRQMSGPNGVWIAGEGVTEDGIILERCIDEGKIVAHAMNAECGLMAEAHFGDPDSSELLDSVLLKVMDFRLASQWRKVDEAAGRATESADHKAALEGAETVNSF